MRPRPLLIRSFLMRLRLRSCHSWALIPHKTPNIKILNYLDVLRLFKYEPCYDVNYHPGVIACIKAKEDCKTYDVDIKHIQKQRTGNFWLDIFVVKREEQRTGWNFRALILIVDDLVVYKLSGGQSQAGRNQDEKESTWSSSGYRPSSD